MTSALKIRQHGHLVLHKMRGTLWPNILGTETFAAKTRRLEMFMTLCLHPSIELLHCVKSTIHPLKSHWQITSSICSQI